MMEAVGGSGQTAVTSVCWGQRGGDPSDGQLDIGVTWVRNLLGLRPPRAEEVVRRSLGR